MTTIDRTRLHQLIDEDDVTVIEVLDKKFYDKFHLPGALNVPIGESFDNDIQAAVPNKSDPVVVYCMDTQCDASPKAAARMEQLGYDHVYDYEAGKLDWRDAGLPTES